LAAATIALYARRTAAGFVGVLFFAVLSPTLVIPLVREIAVERRMYVPLMGLAPLAVIGGFVVVQRLCELLNGRDAARGTSCELSRRGPFVVPMVATMLAALGVVVAFGLVTSHRLEAYRDALTLWQDTVLREPADPDAHTSLGIELTKKGDAAAAIKEFERAVELEEGFFAAHFNLACALRGVGRHFQAIDHFERAIEIKPDYAEAYNDLGDLYRSLGRNVDAIECFQAAVRCDPDLAVAHANLGASLLALRQNDAALLHFQEAARLSGSMEGYATLASVYHQLGRTDDAIAAAERAVALARETGDIARAKQIEAIVTTLRGK
jgi:Flp pilus assembly protein TadD